MVIFRKTYSGSHPSQTQQWVILNVLYISVFFKECGLKFQLNVPAPDSKPDKNDLRRNRTRAVTDQMESHYTLLMGLGKRQ